MMKHIGVLMCALPLAGCFSGPLGLPDFKGPAQWKNASENALFQETDAQSLQDWWFNFGDATLNNLIETALADNPDRRAAQARILEARGIRRTSRSGFFPQISGSTQRGREKGLFNGADVFFDARFDASYEIDVFGRVRNTASAAQNQLAAREAQYQDISLTLVAEIARAYIDLRAAQKQVEIAQENLFAQEKTLELIQNLYEAGENPKLDTQRAENVVNTTKASIPEFERRAENARIELGVLMGGYPEDLPEALDQPGLIPGSDVAPVLMSPAKILALRPDIRAASANLRAQTDLAEAATAEIFPALTLGGFYGVAEAGFASFTQIWQIGIGAAASILDFGRIEGQIDAARARELEAFELYRASVLDAVAEVETALNDYAKLNERAALLYQAYENADAAFTLSKTLYSEGEIDFLDVLDSQRTVNNAQSDFVTAEAGKAEALIRLYKSLGIGPG